MRGFKIDNCFATFFYDGLYYKITEWSVCHKDMCWEDIGIFHFVLEITQLIDKKDI